MNAWLELANGNKLWESTYRNFLTFVASNFVFNLCSEHIDNTFQSPINNMDVHSPSTRKRRREESESPPTKRQKIDEEVYSDETLEEDEDGVSSDSVVRIILF